LDDNRVYWDSDCFLAWLKQEPGKYELCEATRTKAESNEIIIVTSALTIAEVLYKNKNERIPKKDKELVVAFFKNEFIAIRNVTRSIAELARDLVWDHGLKPKDSIHAATAIDAKIEIIETFDKDFIKRSGQIPPYRLYIQNPEPPIQRKLI
jgi:predicted nucleic acid-binding protein